MSSHTNGYILLKKHYGMNKIIAIAILALLVIPLVLVEVQAGGGDEHYYDHGEDNEASIGPGIPPEDGMVRLEPRTRNKDN